MKVGSNSPTTPGRSRLAKGLDFGYSGLLKASFVERPNRFLVRCRVGKRVVEAFMPNPGRMREILLPGVELRVRRNRGSGGSDRRTAFTVFAAVHRGRPVFLQTHETNRVARALLDRGLIEPLTGARLLRSEVSQGRSRFDFLMEEAGREMYLEVKACTLVGNGGALFPDAVTERGRRHLLELAALSRPKAKPVVLILVQHPDASWFLPDYHTDPAFSDAFWEVRKKVRFVPVALRWNQNMTLDPRVKILDIPWDRLRAENRDRGAYLLILRLRRGARIATGSLGPLEFKAGFYVYAGSALKGLAARLARHGRRRKTLHWHVDYLRERADRVVGLPIRTSKDIECELAEAVSRIFEPGPRGFGSSDCSCPSHLFYGAEDPMRLRAFHDLLERYRLDAPVLSDRLSVSGP